MAVQRKLQTIAALKRTLKQCTLCGEFVLHGAVKGPGAERVFRASVALDGVVWVPIKGHSHPAHCPDPPPATARFWGHAAKREAYKQRRREIAEAQREHERN